MITQQNAIRKNSTRERSPNLQELTNSASPSMTTLVLLLVFGSRVRAQTNANMRFSTTHTTRGVYSGTPPPECHFSMPVFDNRNVTTVSVPPVTFGHFASMHRDDAYYNESAVVRRALELTVDKLNMERCGVRINGVNRPIELHSYADSSSLARTYALGRSLSSENTTDNRTQIDVKADFLISGWSGYLTGQALVPALGSASLLMTGSEIPSETFVNQSNVFGTLPPADTLFDSAFSALTSFHDSSKNDTNDTSATSNNTDSETTQPGNKARRVPRTAAAVWDETAECHNVQRAAIRYGLQLTSLNEIDSSAGVRGLLSLVERLKTEEEPDVMITCSRSHQTCADWIGALRKSNWSPKAQIFAFCAGTDDLRNLVSSPHDLGYMMSVTPWHRSLPHSSSEVVGWESAEEFASAFEDHAMGVLGASSHAAASAVAMSTIVRAIEEAGSTETDAVRAKLVQAGNRPFSTIMGELTFDTNGQSTTPYYLLQYDLNGFEHTLYPVSGGSSTVGSTILEEETSRTTPLLSDMVYPMPSWSHRDCAGISGCPSTGIGCAANGTCICDPNELNMVSLGIGADAVCKLQPQEDMRFLAPAVEAVGITLVTIQGLMTAGAMLWTWIYREKPTVKASQPEFLLLTAFGCFVSTVSILPMAIEAGYRFDPTSMVSDGNVNEGVGAADAACMAQEWLYGIGFAIVFSALFSKIWRVKLIFMTKAFRRKKVTAKHVASIMVAVLTVEFIILLSWQIVAPFIWQRQVLLQDVDGFPLQSVGYCTSENGWKFLVALATFHLAILLYALYLCYVTRNIPSKYAESRWIAASVLSMFQILLIAIPTMLLTAEDRDAYYFVRAGFKFLNNAAVTLLIFGPKMYQAHVVGDKESVHSSYRRSSVSSSIPGLTNAARRTSAHTMSVVANGLVDSAAQSSPQRFSALDSTMSESIAVTATLVTPTGSTVVAGTSEFDQVVSEEDRLRQGRNSVKNVSFAVPGHYKRESPEAEAPPKVSHQSESSSPKKAVLEGKLTSEKIALSMHVQEEKRAEPSFEDCESGQEGTRPEQAIEDLSSPKITSSRVHRISPEDLEKGSADTKP